MKTEKIAQKYGANFSDIANDVAEYRIKNDESSLSSLRKLSKLLKNRLDTQHEIKEKLKNTELAKRILEGLTDEGAKELKTRVKATLKEVKYGPNFSELARDAVKYRVNNDLSGLRTVSILLRKRLDESQRAELTKTELGKRILEGLTDEGAEALQFRFKPSLNGSYEFVRSKPIHTLP